MRCTGAGETGVAVERAPLPQVEEADHSDPDKTAARRFKNVWGKMQAVVRLGLIPQIARAEAELRASQAAESKVRQRTPPWPQVSAT